MDRSEVRQFGLNRSIYSSKIMGMSSVLHSPRSNTERELHLRKSRIANIPDTRNIDLSDKLDFVVVFQGIQIERMSEEIQTLRVRVKEYERQLFNCDNYEVQIKQLTEKCYRLQSEKNSYRQELFDNKQASQLIMNELQQIKKRYVTFDFTTNQKYKLERGRNDELLTEVEKWKARYNALDQSKSNELQAIKRMMEDQSKNYLSRQTKQLVDRFDLQKEEMELLIKNLKQSNIQKETQLKKLKFELENKDHHLQQMEKQVDEYQEKVALLSQENYRLSQMNKSKQNEINKLKDKLKQNQHSILTLTQQIALKSEQVKKITSKVKKIQETANQKESKLTKLQKMSLNDKEKLSQLDRIVFLLKQRETQIESKGKMLERKDKKIICLQDSLKNMQQTQTFTKNQILNLKQQIILSSQTIVELLKKIEKISLVQGKVKQSAQESFSKMETHYTSFRQEINKKTQKIIDYSHKLMSEIHQNQEYINKLQQIVKERSQTIQQIERERLDALENIQQLRQAQNERERLLQENQRLKTRFQHLLEEKDDLIKETEIRQSEIINRAQKQIQSMEQKYQNSIIKNLKHQIHSKNMEITQLKNNWTDLNKKCKEMSRQAQIMHNQKTTLQAKQQQFNNKFKFLSDQLDEKNLFLAKELQSNQQLKQTLQQLTKFYECNIKIQVQSLLNRIHPIENAIRILKNSLAEKLIKQQKKFLQTHHANQNKINELIKLNTNLIDRNNYLYQSLVAGPATNPKSSQDSNKIVNQFNSEQQHTTINNTIYTSNAATSKTVPSPRGTNENFNTSNIVGLGTKIKETIKGNFNNQISSSIPVQFLIKHIIVCTELEALRQRIGDKNAKVQKMKSSLMVSNVSTNKSFVAVVNGNTRGTTQNIIQPQGQMMLQSNLMSSTLINKLTNPFMHSIVGNNNQTSFIHHSRLIEQAQRNQNRQTQLAIRRVTSEERFPASTSPDSSSILDTSTHKTTGIYTNRMTSVGGLGRNGFKSIGIKKTKIHN